MGAQTADAYFIEDELKVLRERYKAIDVSTRSPGLAEVEQKMRKGEAPYPPDLRDKRHAGKARPKTDWTVGSCVSPGNTYDCSSERHRYHPDSRAYWGYSSQSTVLFIRRRQATIN